jgi:hypothetical protein
MLTRQLRAFVACFIFSITIVPQVCAQNDTPSIFGHALKATLLDPTTYPAPALYYDATMRDWKTSQTFFRNGFFEQNARFTISGFPNDKPVSYEAGRNQILRDAMAVFAVSAAHNFGARLFEDALKQQYPDHRKAIAVIGWIERIGLSAYLSYRVSTPHYRQWKANQQLAAQLGIR